MTLGNNTTVTATDLNLDSAFITLGSGAKINARILTVKNGFTTTLSGGRNNAGINVDGFVIERDASFEQQDSSRVNADSSLFLFPGSTLRVNADSVFVAYEIGGIVDPAKTSTVDVNTGGTFFLGKGLSDIGRNLTFDIDGTSFLRVGKDANLDLGFLYRRNSSGGAQELRDFGKITVQNDGQIDIDGTFVGDGTIAGSGKFLINNSGQIAPGSDLPLTKTATITFENAFEFTNFGTSRNRSRYLVDVDVVGGTPRNDLLQYDDQGFDITNLDSIEVNTASGKTADDLNGQVFTIISSVDSGSTGTLVNGGSYPTIVKGADIPALIDFTVFNNSTNGKDDVTLQADVNFANLAKHSSAKTRNRQGSASLLINAANSGNSAVISSLNTLTNSQVSPNLDVIHPEPYSSYMTVTLEHSDMVMNTVLSNANSSSFVNSGNTKENEGINKGNRFWMNVNYNEGDVNGDDDLANFNYSLSSLTMGQDLFASNDRALGLYLSLGAQKMGEHDRGIQNFNGKVYHLGMYLNQSNFGGWDLRSVFGYAYGDNSSKRNVFLGSSSETPSANYNSHSAYVGVKGTVIGYQNDWMTLSPEFGLNYTYYKQQDFNESGNPNLSLILDSADAQATIASAGLNTRFASLSDSMSIYPLAFVRYEHDFYANANNEHEINAALVAHPDYKQTFVGQNRGEHAIITGLGLGSDISSALQINGSFVYSKNSHGKEWGAGLNMVYIW